MHKPNSIFEAARNVLTEAKGDEYDLMKQIEKELKELTGHFHNFHNAHEADALSEIRGVLSYCLDLTDKIKKKIN